MMQSGQSGTHVNFKIAMLRVDMSTGDGIIGDRNHGGQMGGCVSRGVSLYGISM